MYRPEYLKPGMTILFREGRTKGLGIVTGVMKGNPPPTKKSLKSKAELIKS